MGTKILIGIDPGLSGAIAVLKDDSVEVWDIPTLIVAGAAGTTRREYQVSEMAAILRPYVAHGASVMAGLESVHSMPGQGVRSMFSMGRGLGIWEGLLGAFAIPYTKIIPQEWKRAMLSGMGHDKESSRVRAQQLFPALTEKFSRKRDDGRAEAALIASYVGIKFR